jgi:hypothetical protein
VLDSVDEPSSLPASMSMVVELLEGQIDAAAVNGVHLGSHSALVVVMSHFSLDPGAHGLRLIGV